MHYLRSTGADAVSAGSEKRNSRLEAAWKTLDPTVMTVDELLMFHERVGQMLCTKLQSLSSKVRMDQEKLQAHLSKLRSGLITVNEPELEAPTKPARRPYPTVYPKYRSLRNPSLTWAGRGKQPRWLLAEMKDGKTLSDFLIDKPTNKRRKGR
ncbi:H-NS family nucleoid-associated regulatory protein [Rhodopseudomonas telluris]|uniref:H-NS family nucleoid-associated regulatory protein n=1 Tax=Rhodopseudomonas telluris TaxID=644215 RepID=A0ABV6EVU8_9BRAD